MWRALRNLSRLVRAARILARHNALFLLGELPLPAPLPWLIARVSTRDAPGRPGERLARAMTELGPAFIKLGQTLAVRDDLIGAEVARDLAQLQDRLAPFPSEAARAMVEAELGAPLAELFSDFDDAPVAAASIAQVHFATTTDGREVAVKILRPGIEARLEDDLDLFLWLAQGAERLAPAMRRLRPVETVLSLRAITRRELDLRLEAAAAAEFAQNCANDDGFRVPAVDWARTGRRVATFERVSGLPMIAREQLQAAGHDPDKIMATAARVFFNQVFRDGLFHGDMHPGNMLVDAGGNIVALDFGIMGRLDLATRRHLAEILLGFLTGDYRQVADVFFRVGFLPQGQDREAFQQAVRAVGEPIFGLPLAQISMGRLLGQLLSMAGQFEMVQQPELVLLQKTMVVAEGVGRRLNPAVNIWQLSQPLVEDWMRANLGPQARLRDGMGGLREAVERLPRILAEAERLMLASERRGRTHEIWEPTRLRELLLVALGIALGLALGR